MSASRFSFIALIHLPFPPLSHQAYRWVVAGKRRYHTHDVHAVALGPRGAMVTGGAWDRERDRERQRKKERKKERERGLGRDTSQ